MAKKVLSVGQCAADHGTISRFIAQHFEADVVAVESADRAAEALQLDTFDLVLVNRILDLDGSSGIELIRQLKGQPSTERVPVMLVSNFAEAQREAVFVGAEPGIGKASLGDAATIATLRPFLT